MNKKGVLLISLLGMGQFEDCLHITSVRVLLGESDCMSDFEEEVKRQSCDHFQLALPPQVIFHIR